MAFKFAPKPPRCFTTLALLILLLSSTFFPWVSHAASGGSMGGSSRGSSSGSSSYSFGGGGGYSSRGSSYGSGYSSSSGGGYGFYNPGYGYGFYNPGYGYGGDYYFYDYVGAPASNDPHGDRVFLIVTIAILSLILLAFVVLIIWVECGCKWIGKRNSVIMIQVGLPGKARSLQKQLNQIAKTTNTSSSLGWRHILRATTSALLRNSQHFISCYSLVKHYYSTDSAEDSFQELAAKERAKFDIESLVNVNNVKIQREVIPQASKDGKDHIVVTILVAASCRCKIPRIKSKDGLKKALESLDSNIKFHTDLLGVEVLWTPQNEEDTLSEKELHENYSALKPIS
ncbi:hypothetical protein Tsubulata_033526 [Turnera subulata]|uniref:Uncharacterized protein n=1 Tax=Turnera subulata TaxID=218843 RepID=A0A9Q0F5U8_9ROSI|nr:hypothetical protein Tsubulata_033526 [Turnera subulata]